MSDTVHLNLPFFRDDRVDIGDGFYGQIVNLVACVQASHPIVLGAVSFNIGES